MVTYKYPKESLTYTITVTNKGPFTLTNITVLDLLSDINGNAIIECSKKYFRPAEVDELLGDSTKARKELGWHPKYTFTDLLEEMVNFDCK